MRSNTPTTRKSRRLRLAAAVVAGALALGAGTALTTGTLTAGTPSIPAAMPAAAMQSLPKSFADVVERVGPAVVNIRTEGRAGPSLVGQRHMKRDGHDERGYDERGEDDDHHEYGPRGDMRDFMRRFFGDDFHGRGRNDDHMRRVEGAGSGFIVDKAGYVVTNNHVVRKAEKITVTLQDGREFAAKLVGRDAKTDLALLKVEAGEALPFVAFAKDEKVRVGDWVVTVGNPFGLGHTVTAGIVSARGRHIGSGPYDDYLQIDAAINRGNSGGPAFNLAGDVVGVNTAIFSPHGGNVGIGFAIPASMAGEVIEDLKTTGRVERGWLGVQIQRVTPDIADGLGLKKPEGALVADVVAGGPAAAAGLRPGDVILEVDGKHVRRMRDLPRLIAGIDAGKSAKLEIWRDGDERDISVNIGDMPRDEAAAVDGGKDDGVIGMTVATLDDAARKAFGLADDLEGVIVTDVKPGGAAADKGIRKGDVIVAVGGKRVASADDVARHVDAAKRDKRRSVLFQVRRGEASRFVAVPLKAA